MSAASALVAGFAAQAPGAILLQENFDSYTAGSTLTTNGWAAIGGSGNLISNAQSVSTPNSANADTVNSRSRKSFTESGVPTALNPITFSFDFYDSNAGLSPYRQYANLQDTTAPSATNQLVSMGLNNNQTSAANGGNYYMARILGYTASDSGATSGSYFKLNGTDGAGNSLGTNPPLRSTGWHNLKVVISSDDGLSTDYAFYVDGILAKLAPNVGTAASMRSYDNVTLGSGLSSTAEVFFDNVSVDNNAIPEPTSVALLGIGAMGLLARRRRMA